MKKVVIFTLIFACLAILFISSVQAGRYYLLDDFNEKPVQERLLAEKDALVFNYKQGRHVVVFDGFNSKGGIDLSIFVFQESYNITRNQTVSYLSLKPRMYTYIDFDKDFIEDLEISYPRQIKENATLVFKSLNSSDINILHVPEEEKDNLQNNNVIMGILIIFGIIIAGLLVYFIFTRTKKKPHS